MVDFQLVYKLREESKKKLNEADTLARTVSDIILEIRVMKTQIINMEANVDRLTHEEHKTRLEGDRLKNQAFVMSLGEPNE